MLNSSFNLQVKSNLRYSIKTNEEYNLTSIMLPEDKSTFGAQNLCCLYSLKMSLGVCCILQKCVTPFKSSAFLEDPRQVWQHFCRVRATQHKPITNTPNRTILVFEFFPTNHVMSKLSYKIGMEGVLLDFSTKLNLKTKSHYVLLMESLSSLGMMMLMLL